ncbi:hypothetical protein BANRA_02174 [Escherichia coli]|nr:hypothetical protein BANRA_02174 [Escherichia coli]
MDSTVYIHKAIEETLLEKEFLTLKGVEKLRPENILDLFLYILLAVNLITPYTKS